MQLRAENITIGHHQPLVNNIRVDLKPESCVALMGINGSGKSTLLRTLAGLQHPLQGEVLIDGKNLYELPIRERSDKFSLVRPQTEFPGLCTVIEFVLSGILASMNWTGLHDNNDYLKADETLRTVGIYHLRNRYMSSLSDGERQKTAIARALLANTPFVFLDEPVSFLDIPGKRDIMKMIQMLAASGKTVLYSSHDMDASISYSTHIWLLKDNTLEQGFTADMMPRVHGYFNL